jgi:hypothetical protein
MSENETMSEKPESDDERPCLHCLISDLIYEFYDEYGSNSGEEDTIDVDEILTAVAKVVADMTSSCAATLRRHIFEQLPREIAKFEAEFSAEDANASESQVRH